MFAQTAASGTLSTCAEPSAATTTREPSTPTTCALTKGSVASADPATHTASPGAGGTSSEPRADRGTGLGMAHPNWPASQPKRARAFGWRGCLSWGHFLLLLSEPYLKEQRNQWRHPYNAVRRLRRLRLSSSSTSPKIWPAATKLCVGTTLQAAAVVCGTQLG